MSEAPTILDPSAQFIDDQQEALVDFIFRLTADRSRAAVMGREACRQMKDDLSSGLDESGIKTRLFQLAYELNEEAMRPIPRNFFENWYRYQHHEPRTVAPAFRWELRLLDLGHHAAQLLLLRYRYQFSTAVCAHIMNRDIQEIEDELITLEELIRQDKHMDLQYLAQLPRYGFLDVPEQQQTALSHLMNHMRPHHHLWSRLAIVLALAMLGGFIWMLFAFSAFTKLWRVFRLWLIGS